MVTIGLIGTTIMTFIFITINTNPDLWMIRAILFFRGLSMAFAVIPVQAAAFTNVSRKDTGRASAIFNTNRQVASSFGVAILGTVLFELLLTRSTVADQLFAYHLAFVASVVLGFFAIAFALTIHDEDAAASLKK